MRTRQYSSVKSVLWQWNIKDKAFDLKLRLWEESYWLPQVAVGRDIGGTGLFMRDLLLPARPGGRSILRSAWDGDIWAPAVM
ncbi:YjbH domain-containing protein [Escherichia coli]